MSLCQAFDVQHEKSLYAGAVPISIHSVTNHHSANIFVSLAISQVLPVLCDYYSAMEVESAHIHDNEPGVFDPNCYTCLMLQALHDSDSHSSSEREGSSASDSDTDEDTSCTKVKSVHENKQKQLHGTKITNLSDSDSDTDEDTSCTEGKPAHVHKEERPHYHDTINLSESDSDTDEDTSYPEILGKKSVLESGMQTKNTLGGAVLLSDYSRDTTNFSRSEHLKKARAEESTLVEDLTRIHASKPHTKDVPDVNQQNDTHIKSKQQKTKKNVPQRKTSKKKFPQEKKQAKQTKHQLKNAYETAPCEPCGKAKFTPEQNQPSKTTDMNAQQTHVSRSQSGVVNEQPPTLALKTKLAERTKRQSKKAYEIARCVPLGKPNTPGQNRQSKTTNVSVHQTHTSKNQSGVVNEQPPALTLKTKLAERTKRQSRKAYEIARCVPLGKPNRPGQNRQSKNTNVSVHQTHISKSQSGVVDEQPPAHTLNKKLAPQKKPMQPTKLIDVSAQCAPTQRQMTLPTKYVPKSKLSGSNTKRNPENDKDQGQNPTERRRINFSNAQPRMLFGEDTAPPKESIRQSITHCQNKRKRLLDHQTEDRPCKRSRNDKENQPKDTPTRLPWKLIKITFPPSQMQTSLNKKKKFKGHPDPRQCLHDGTTNGTELVKEDQAILAAHGFVSPIA